MNTETAHQQFELRYYEWTLMDFHREIDQEYPYLKTIADRGVQSWIMLLEELDREQRRLLLRVLVKNAFRDIIATSEDPFTAQDAATLKQYERVLPMLPPKTPDPSKGDIRPIKVRRLASRIIERLNPILGDQVQQITKMVWSYATPIGDWTVRTRVSIYNPREPEVHYVHQVNRSDYIRTRPYLPSYDFAGCLGLGSTEWRVDYNYELEPAADSLAALCAHFIDAFPRLVEGLSIDD